MARTLSPTQLRPMTTVSHAMHLLRSRPFPAIVHPQPELGARDDATGDHVVDSLRQRHRIPLALRQLIHTNRVLELETMPEAVRNAKSEHNCRVGSESHLRGGGSRPCGMPQKRD